MTYPAPESPEQRGAPGAVAVLLLIVFMSLIGFGIVIPLLPFFATAFDAPPWQVTLLFAMYSAGQRPVLLITIVGSGLGYLALAFAPGIWPAILVRAAAGFFSGNMSVIQGYVVDVSPPAKLAGRLGQIGSAFGVGFVIGPALGGLLARPDLGAEGFRPPLILAAGLCVLATVGILAFVRESRRPGGGAITRGNPFAALGEALRHPVLASAFGVIFCGFFASSIMWSVLGLWAEARFGWGPREVGLVMACTGVVSALVQGIAAGALVRRLGAGATIVCGLVVAAVFLMAMAMSPWGWFAAFTLTASMVGHSLWQPAASALRVEIPGDAGATTGAAPSPGF